MPADTVLDVNISGVYCGVPWSISLAYKQLVADPVLPQTTGREFVEHWFNDLTGPWRTIRENLSTQMQAQCVAISYAGQSESLLLTGAIGLDGTPSWPTQLCVQINTPSTDPHPDSDEGRFFMPGFVMSQIVNGNIDPDFLTDLDSFMLSLLDIDNGSYVLYPHAKYLDRLGGNDSVASLPYYHPFIKIIGGRKADDCATFAASGAPEFLPIDVPLPP